MPTSVHVDELKINKLTEAQYDAAVQAGLIGENELSILTDAASGGQTIQYDTMPTASASNEGDIVQFVGTSDANYTNGYFYQCVSDGAVTPTYSWVAKDVQAGGGGSLPSQTGNAGKFLTTDGTDASWSDKPLVNLATASYALDILGGSTGIYAPAQNATCVGYGARANQKNGTAFGNGADVRGTNGVALGADAYVHNGKSGGIAIGCHAQVDAVQAIQISAVSGDVYLTNNETKTVCIGFGTNENYKVLDSNGTIPEARLADTTNATQGQVLTLDSNNNAVWATPSASVSTVSGTLLSGSTAWGSGTDTQTLTVQGVTSSNTVIVSPTPLSSTDYADTGIICTAQSTNQLTFTCVTVPTNDIELSIVIIG